MTTKYFNLFTVAVIAAALFSAVMALQCHTCSETFYVGSSTTLGDCSQNAWIQGNCTSNASYCISLTTKEATIHRTVKRCTENKDECNQQTGNFTCEICNNKDFCNAAPAISKEFGTVLVVAVGAVMLNFIR